MKTHHSRRSFITHTAIAGALAPLSIFGQVYETAIDRTPKASSPSDLKITKVKCGYIRGSLFVKIYTNQDIWGCGEGVDAIAGTYYLVKNFGERIVGESPLNVHRLFEDIRKSGFFQGAQSGMYVAVLSAIETALWDLAGKALHLPVYQLLGGKFRDKVRVYCDTALYQRNLPTPNDFAEAALNARKMGFNAIKFDLDQVNDPNKYDLYNWTASPAELQRMYDQLAAARQAVGPDIDICADMHGRYDAGTARTIAKRLEPLNLMWLEEPVPAENPAAKAANLAASGIPFAAAFEAKAALRACFIVSSPFTHARVNSIACLGRLSSELGLAHQIGSERIEQQYEVGGFRIDMVIRHKHTNLPLIALECDGAKYHTSPEAYAWDIFRQEQLEHFGFIFYRIWSTKWWDAADRELEKLLNFIRQQDAIIVNTATSDLSVTLDGAMG